MTAAYKNLTATSQVKASAGKLKSIIVATTTGGTLAVYDSAIGATTKPVTGTLTPAAGSVIPFSGDDGVYLGDGIYIVAANTINYTVIYE